MWPSHTAAQQGSVLSVCGCERESVCPEWRIEQAVSEPWSSAAQDVALWRSWAVGFCSQQSSLILLSKVVLRWFQALAQDSKAWLWLEHKQERTHTHITIQQLTRDYQGTHKNNLF